ncbi:hypothetical protein [Haliangium ochraceum]|uniref:Uncharacterized protein n=1 Tax=Haliangium ochraceum (strain DSM 14365 / JCM 11303 / SMP-2) TaxID=502025 RepID=D0LPR3_HALO1|nr:hypothetical protein [Haliangium ochraceum]ACY14140.1 hypothetical protein Hoch_1590 [Haliangium ochraceum DSM 14365]ACY15426.1 hypothetical protein Hoch_2907 [Haliangium ochraceum DSM 14365]
MMRTWRSKLHVTQHEVKLLVTCPEQGDVLKARLPPHARHPRALLTLLEGLSLYNGQPQRIALHVDERFRLTAGLFGDELWPGESPLVQYDIAHRASQCGRLSGIGDFRALRRGSP